MQDGKQYQQEYEELSIKDLVWSVLCRWRILLAACLAGGILLAAFAAWKDYRVMSNEKTKESRQLAYETARADYETQKELLESELKNLRDMQERQQYYRKHSVMLRMDPYETSFITASFRVEWDAASRELEAPAQAAVLRQYQGALEQLDLDTAIADAEDPDLTAANPAGTERRLLEAETDYVNAILSLKVYAENDEQAGKIFAAAKETIEMQQKMLEQTAGAHHLATIDERRWTGADAGLVNVQTEFRNAMTEIASFITETEKSLSSLSAPRNTVPTAKTMIRNAVKTGALGAAAGLILSAGFLMLKIVLEDRLNNTEEIEQRYGVPVLGTQSAGGKAARLDCSIAKKLGADPGRPAGDSAEFIAAGIRLLMKDGGKLALVGTCGDEKLNALAKTLAPLLDGVSVTAAGNINKSAAAVAALRENDAVVCAEEWQKASHREIRRELQTAADSGIRNLGVIVLC